MGVLKSYRGREQAGLLRGRPAAGGHVRAGGGLRYSVRSIRPAGPPMETLP